MVDLKRFRVYVESSCIGGVFMTVLIGTILIGLDACGAIGPMSGGHDSLTGPAITTLTPLDTVTDSQALAFFSTQGFGDCYPGGSITYSSFKDYVSDSVQGIIAKPVSSSTLNWSTSDAKVATAASGVVTCLSTGTVKITATIPDVTCGIPGCSATGIAVVGPAKHTLALSPSTGVYHVGETIIFTATLSTQTPDGKVTTQDVTSSIATAGGTGGVEYVDSLDGVAGKQVLTPAATSISTNNLYKAANPGMVWAFATYSVPGIQDDIVQSNVVTITVQ